MTLTKDSRTFTNDFCEDFYYRILLTLTNVFLMMFTQQNSSISISPNTLQFDYLIQF